MIAKSARMRWSRNPKNEDSVKSIAAGSYYFGNVRLRHLSSALKVSMDARVAESENRD